MTRDDAIRRAMPSSSRVIAMRIGRSSSTVLRAIRPMLARGQVRKVARWWAPMSHTWIYYRVKPRKRRRPSS